MATAEQLPDGLAKRVLMEMAAAWVRLADQSEKNLAADLVYEPPLRPVGTTSRVVQQQQQSQPNKTDENSN